MRLKLISMVVVCWAAILVAPMGASADTITTVPAGLNPGDQYRLAFVTALWRTATSTYINDYNRFVNSIGNGKPLLAALGTTWIAIASTEAVDARDNTNTNPAVSTGVPIFRLDGVLIANHNADLWDDALAASLSITESGNALSRFVWTGSRTNGDE